MILPHTFAQKRPGSEINVNDLKLIIESNERGKKAQAKIPLLEEKVDTLESIVARQSRLINSKDSTIQDAKAQVVALQQIRLNSLQVIDNKDQELAIINSRLKDMTKNYKSQKRKTTFVGIAFAMFSGTLLYFYTK